MLDVINLLDLHDVLMVPFVLCFVAPPDPPFPSVEECNDTTDGSCSLPLWTSNITCTVSGYFPNISLFFRHGEVVMNSTRNMEWTKADGTKNKSVTVLADASDDPYVCVASDIPGQEDHVLVESATIFVVGIPRESTTEYVTNSTLLIDTTSHGGKSNMLSESECSIFMPHKTTQMIKALTVSLARKESQNASSQ